MIKTNITGNCKVFRNDITTKNGGTFPRYTVSFSKKMPDGNYENAYMTARFKKGVDLANMTDITIDDAWLTFDKYEKDGKKLTSWAVFINEFSDNTPFQPPQERPDHPDVEQAFAATNDEIPF